MPNGDNIDLILEKMKPSFSSNFTKKWTSKKWHPRSHHPHCNKTITMDGCWKCSRAKCCYDEIYYKTEEFGDLQIGCIETPDRGSYYCKKHVDYELAFNVNGGKLKIKPKDIKISKFSKDVYLTLINYQLNSKKCYIIKLGQ